MLARTDSSGCLIEDCGSRMRQRRNPFVRKSTTYGLIGFGRSAVPFEVSAYSLTTWMWPLHRCVESLTRLISYWLRSYGGSDHPCTKLLPTTRLSSPEETAG